jgi:hypothetical protein
VRTPGPRGPCGFFIRSGDQLIVYANDAPAVPDVGLCNTARDSDVQNQARILDAVRSRDRPTAPYTLTDGGPHINRSGNEFRPNALLQREPVMSDWSRLASGWKSSALGILLSLSSVMAEAANWRRSRRR